MKRVALVTMIAGVFMGVMAIGTLMTGWWGLSPYALMTAGALLILAAALASVAGGRAERPLPVAEGQKLLRECEEVVGVCRAARVALLERLIDAPRKVVAHSRVTDVEKALDNLEAATTAALKCLQVRS